MLTIDDIAIVALQPAHVPEIAKFEAEIARISFPDDPVTDLAFYEKKLGRAARNREPGTFVAEAADGTPLGWAWISKRENFVTGETYGDFRSLFVAEAARTLPVGLKLMQRCEQFCGENGLTKIVGRTSVHNDTMLALYDVFGFASKHVVLEKTLG